MHKFNSIKIFLNDQDSKYLETTSFENWDYIDETLNKFSLMKRPLQAKIFAINESISSTQLKKFKNNFEKSSTCSLHIYSNNRETILAGKSLKIDSTFVKEQEIKNKLLFMESKKNMIFFTMEQ